MKARQKMRRFAVVPEKLKTEVGEGIGIRPLQGEGFTVVNSHDRLRFGVLDRQTQELCYRDRSQAEAWELAYLLEHTFGHGLRRLTAWDLFMRTSQNHRTANQR